MTDVLSTGFVSRRNNGESFADIFLNGCIEVRSGAQPATADMPPTGTLLGRITRGGGLWTAGSPANGLQFVAEGRYVGKDPSHVWRLVGQATGVAGWYRMLPNEADDGSLSTTRARIDGAIGLLDTEVNAQMWLLNTSLTNVYNEIVTHFWRGTLPLT